MTDTHPVTPLPASVSAHLARSAEPGFDAWRRSIVRLNGCTNPIHLVGSTALADPATGEVLHTYTPETDGGRLLIACGNRRTAVCPTCARLYRTDTYHLVRVGLVGGKEITPEVGGHPRVFATLTAPGFGPVHTRRERDGRVVACRPRKAADHCPHGMPLGCHLRHAETDLRPGEPLCPRCYDYAGAVLWQAHAGKLWHRFALELRRELARLVGLSRTEFTDVARLSYVKVAEYQRRGLVHFHAVVRLDGPDGPVAPPPAWATAELLTNAVRTAAELVRLPALGADVVGRRTLRFGPQVDVRPIASLAPDPDTRLSSAAVAGYIAKYATKGAEPAGAVDRRIHHARDLAELPVRAHTLRMIGTCWWLGGLETFEPLGLRRWAHMLGYRGHFSTKSRRYSTTLTDLRQARTDHRAQERHAALGLANRHVISVGNWRYAGRGYTPEAAVLAASVREDGGDHDA
ncbi:replication initiator [Streptomyces sp. NPDC093252]|uniref:replication initiator n=1 Tax=Streptomyces sp. NPDC093252 TaxID=3154980 RepID=UPI003421B11C